MTVENELLECLKDALTPDLTMEELVENGCLELEKRLQESDTSMLSGGSSILPCAPRGEKMGFLHIALDLGGSFVKLGFVNAANLKVSNCASMAIHAVSVNVQFFRSIVEWICEQAAKFLCEREINPSTVIFELGLTFGFPLTPHGQITTMGKGFQLSDEVKAMKMTVLLQRLFLETQMKGAYGYEVRVGGIVNDSVAVFLANAATEKDNDVSLILGTGINACFSLPSERIPSRKTPGESGDGAVAQLINSEIGFLGQDFIKLSEFDPKDETLFMPLEYVTAGKWIPLTLKNIIFRHNLSSGAAEHLNFDGKLICDILNGSSIAAFGRDQPVIKALTYALIERAAFYATGALLSMLKFTGDDRPHAVRVGYAGSFLRNCTAYRDLIYQFSAGKIELEFLEHSNLIGAHVNSLRCHDVGS
ncbi:LAFA_0G13410g1_1 [Lachancea sp. 'fantastica']|nr:LAFA_0G13410g1_1 [Lachancea sp. 'fantastica']